MPVLAPRNLCSGCTACLAICPCNASRMEADEEGFLYPLIDIALCTQCGLCEQICPSLHPNPTREPLAVYAAINRDKSIRMKSSSGGIFTLLAEHTLRDGGIVFGAGWNNDLQVVHCSAMNETELADLRGSKYVQSEVRNCYREVRGWLEMERKVLFSGTPCQIAGLRSFLQKDYANLLCVDIFCFGVPSPLVFEYYKSDLEKKFDAKINRIFFRDKENGWKQSSIVVLFNDGSVFRESLYDNLFVKSFLRALCNRPSCHACPFRSLRSGADVSIGDFWGINLLSPDIDDDCGVSAVLLNSEQGQSCRTWLANGANIHLVSYTDVVKYNPMLVKSVEAHPKRDLFLRKIRGMAPFRKTVVRILRPPLYYLALSVLCRILRFLALRG